MRRSALIYFLLCISILAIGQNCPPNIGFEDGNFDHWVCNSGSISPTGEISIFSVVPRDGRHTLYKRDPQTIDKKDPYGHFPVLSPNGSDYSIRLGDDEPGHQVDQVTYDFVVPSNSSSYSFIFNYAVVLQVPGHSEFEQPRFQVKLYNETRGEYVKCGSFDFVAGFSQPDFQVSNEDREVLFKPWSSVTLNLGGYAGESLRLEFSVNDCTRGGHFGYAYVDVNNLCGDPVSGSIICSNNSSTVLYAPLGFKEYEWYNGDLSSPLGTGPSLSVSPVFPGDSFALIIIPYAYLGCLDTMTIRIRDDIEELKLVVKDTVNGCFIEGIDLTKPQLTAGSGSNLQFGYFFDSAVSRVVPNPVHIVNPGTYYIRAINTVGCVDVKPVTIVMYNNPVFTVTDPPEIKFPESIDLALFASPSNLNYSWWRDKNATQSLPNPHTLQTSGEYYVKATEPHGCSAIQPVLVKVQPIVYVPDAFTPNQDGRNDVFIYKALGGGIKVEFFNIYNRWGQLVFTTTVANAGWDGKAQGKEQASDVYVWTLKLSDYKGRLYVQQGTVMLVR